MHPRAVFGGGPRDSHIRRRSCQDRVATPHFHHHRRSGRFLSTNHHMWGKGCQALFSSLWITLRGLIVLPGRMGVDDFWPGSGALGDDHDVFGAVMAVPFTGVQLLASLASIAAWTRFAQSSFASTRLT